MRLQQIVPQCFLRKKLLPFLKFYNWSYVSYLSTRVVFMDSWKLKSTNASIEELLRSAVCAIHCWSLGISCHGSMSKPCCGRMSQACCKKCRDRNKVLEVKRGILQIATEIDINNKDKTTNFMNIAFKLKFHRDLSLHHIDKDFGEIEFSRVRQGKSRAGTLFLACDNIVWHRVVSRLSVTVFDNFFSKNTVQILNSIVPCHLEIKPLVVPADSGNIKTPPVGWDFSDFCVLSGLFSTWKPTLSF